MEIDLDIRGEEYSEKDKELDVKLRPLQFKDFSGQKQIVENLEIFVKAAKMRGESLDHVLLHGPPGLGKTTLATIIANRINNRWGEFVSIEPEDKKSEGNSTKKSGNFSIKKLILLLLAIFIIVMVLWGEPIMPYLGRYMQLIIKQMQNLLS